MGDVGSQEDRRRHIMATLYELDARGKAALELASLARFIEADPEDVKGDILYLEGAGLVTLSGSRVALTEAGYIAMNNREFSFCPHL